MSAPVAEALYLARTLRAPPERVFRAWTDPERVARWFAPDPGWRVNVVELNARVGGRFVIEMIEPGGEIHRASGEYRTFQPPERLVFTWDNFGAPLEHSVVILEFNAVDEGTEFLLTHERLLTTEMKEQHLVGWEGCLARLPDAL